MYKKALVCTGILLLNGSIWAGKDYFMIEYKLLEPARATEAYVLNDGSGRSVLKDIAEVNSFGPKYIYIWRQKYGDNIFGLMRENKLYNCLYGPTIWSRIEYEFKRFAINYIQTAVGIDKATGKINISDDKLNELVDKLWNDASRKIEVRVRTGDTGSFGEITKQENLIPDIPVFDAPESARKKC